MAYTTVLLDLDNTIFDFNQSEVGALHATMREFGIEPTPEVIGVYEPINRALWDAVERGEYQPDDVRYLRFERFAEALGRSLDPVAMGDHFVAGLGRHGELYPGAREVLAELANITTLAMATNGLGDVQREKIARLDLEQYFEVITISGEVGCAKPSVEFFDVIFDQLGEPKKTSTDETSTDETSTDKTSTIIVGDSHGSDMAGGRAYGIATCWYNPTGKPNTSGADVDHEIADLRELIGLVRD